MKKKTIILIMSIVIIAGIAISLFIFFYKSNIVARYITDEHYRYSPVLYQGDLYFPSDFGAAQVAFENTDPIEFLGYHRAGWFYDTFMLTGSIQVDNDDKERLTFRVVDDLPMTYAKGTYLKIPELLEEHIEKNAGFVLCSDSGAEGDEIRLTIDKSLVTEIVNDYSTFDYHVDDFISAEKRYYIYVNEPKKRIHDRTFDSPIIYIGTILYKDNQYFFGNLTNEIEGELLEGLKRVIKD